MEAKENKQQITIPFIWEEKPGAPKDNWKTTTKRELLTPVPNPVKYVASVPFKWEEKPGTPLSRFVEDTKEEHEGLKTKLEIKSLPLPPAYFAKFGNESNGDSSSGDDYENQDWLSELEFETLSIFSEESFCSAPSLKQFSQPTQGRVTVSSAERHHDPVLDQHRDGYFGGSASSEIRSSSISAGRNANSRGSFMQYLDSQVQYSNERRLPTLEEYEKLKAEFRQNGTIRRPMTLGELIMQSRRRSYRQQAVQQKKKNTPQDLNEKPHGCFNLGGTGGGGLTKLLGKDLLSLKLS